MAFFIQLITTPLSTTLPFVHNRTFHVPAMFILRARNDLGLTDKECSHFVSQMDYMRLYARSKQNTISSYASRVRLPRPNTGDFKCFATFANRNVQLYTVSSHSVAMWRSGRWVRTPRNSCQRYSCTLSVFSLAQYQDWSNP